jgi:hypothetical protein
MLPIHAMRRAISSLLLLLGIAGVACATDYAGRYRLAHPDWTPAPPVAGDSLEKTLASLQTTPEGPFRVSVRELRLLRVDVEPWEILSDVAGTEASTIGVIADRRCRGRQGIDFFDSERFAWYIFVAGELVSYDHFEFGETCEPQNHYLPSRIELLSTERALIRYAASRYPESMPTTEELLSKGLALVSVDRLPDAKRMLRTADREIHVMTAKALNAPEEDRVALEEREKRLRAMRAKLSRAIADAEKKPRTDEPLQGDEMHQCDEPHQGSGR